MGHSAVIKFNLSRGSCKKLPIIEFWYWKNTDKDFFLLAQLLLMTEFAEKEKNVGLSS